MTDPFASNVDGTPAATDTFDPFGDTQPEDLRSFDGPMLPFPRVADLYRHLVVMEPTGYTDKDVDPFAPAGSNKTRELFTVRLTILEGDALELPNGKKNEAGVWEPDGTVTIVGPGSEHPWPVTWNKFSVPQTQIIGKLKAKFDVATSQPKDGGFLLGVIRRVPAKKTAKHLTTPEAIDKALTEFYQAKMAGKNVPEVNYGWGFVNYTNEQKAIALDWYRNRTS